jgi:tellurite resistance protein
MVSKTKSKVRKKGKQTRGTRKSKPLKKRGAKKTNTRVVRPKRAQRASSRRSRVAESSGQENELLAQENASSISSVDENVTNDEQQGDIQLTQPDATLKGATTDEPLDIEENIEDQNSSTSEIQSI